jgi:hypothetical protein
MYIGTAADEPEDLSLGVSYRDCAVKVPMIRTVCMEKWRLKRPASA